jgi:hypothetical protein
MTGRQEYDRTKDRQRILDEYMIDNAIITTDTWSVGNESIAMFELTTWHASFLDFFISLRGFPGIRKQITETGFAE